MARRVNYLNNKDLLNMNPKITALDIANYLGITVQAVHAKIKSLNLIGDSFSVDVMKDYLKAKKQIVKDKFFKLYDEN